MRATLRNTDVVHYRSWTASKSSPWPSSFDRKCPAFNTQEIHPSPVSGAQLANAPCKTGKVAKDIFVVLGSPELLNDIARVSDHVADGFCLRGVVELPDFHLGLILREMSTGYFPRKPS